MKNEEVRYATLKQVLLLLIPVVIVSGFIYLFNKQENNIDEKLSKCSFYTIASPVEMFGSHKFRFRFFYKGKYYTRDERVGAGDLGYSYTRADVLRQRFWVRVQCADFNTFRFYWKCKVPEDLQDVPIKGWTKIPKEFQ